MLLVPRSKNVIGTRPGEKIHEEMITAADSFTTYDLGQYYAIFPTCSDLQSLYQANNRSCELVTLVFPITLVQTTIFFR